MSFFHVSHRVFFLATIATIASFTAPPQTVLGNPPDTTPSISTISLLTGCGGEQMPTINPEFEAEVVMLVNKIRDEHGLAPLKRAPSLDAAARYHATDMALDNYFSHASYDRVNDELVEVCPWSDRLRAYYTDWYAIAENIGAGYATPQDVVDAWMNSPGHRKNILSDSNWEIGVGYYEAVGSYGRYWVQDFGRRRDVYPLVIDSEAPVTETGDVTLYLYGEWDDVRVRTQDGSWSDWMSFQTELAWTLTGQAGEVAVTVEMRKSHRSAVSTDSIFLLRDSAPAPEQPYSLYLPQLAASGQ